MGKKGKWFGVVKKVFSPESKVKKAEKARQKLEYSKLNDSDPHNSKPVVSNVPVVAAAAPLFEPPAEEIVEEIKLDEVEDEQSKHAYSVALATQAAVAAAQAAADVVCLTTSTKFAGKSKEEIAAIRIQTAFRGYLARRALQALRGLVRLKSMMHGNAVKRQATTTLRCMQTLARVQSQIRSRRVRMSEENQALQRQLLLKRDRELEKLRMGEEWDDSLHSKEQIEASIHSKQEAAMRRERALAYAFSHQWKSSSRSTTPLFMDPNNPQWGWSWLERWMAAQPWETTRGTTSDKEPNSEIASLKSASYSNRGEVSNGYTRRESSLDNSSPAGQKSSRPPSRQSPKTPPPKTPPITGKMKSPSLRNGWNHLDDDSRSILSMQSGRPRRHSMGGSLVRDDESLASSPSVPSYMVPTESARAKSRFLSQSSVDKVTMTPGRTPLDSVKKCLSFPAADKRSMAARRRHSGPPKLSAASIKEIAAEITNGGSC